MSQSSLTTSGPRRLGDEYQDVQALDRIVAWLGEESLYQWIRLEADDGGFLDDIQTLCGDGTPEFWQVKFSTHPGEENDEWTWKKLMAEAKGARGPRASLLQKWFNTWRETHAKAANLRAGLVSNRRLAVEIDSLLDNERKIVWDKLKSPLKSKLVKHLGGEAEVRQFVESFQWRTTEAGLRELEAGAFARFERLGGTLHQWHRLWIAVRKWVASKELPTPDRQITRGEILRECGLRALPARLQVFLPPSAYFQPFLKEGRLFHHRMPLVGRRPILKKLLQWSAFSDALPKRIAILPGRGGNGKSRLLREFCRRFQKQNPTWDIRLLAENQAVTSQALNELRDENCLVIVDDAHNRAGIEVLLGVAEQNPRLYLLFATRPHATNYLLNQCLSSGFDTREVAVFEPLEMLSFPREIDRLARLSLGADARHYVHDLAYATRDCPLLTVLGGQLLRENRIAPALLSRNQEFRAEVLRRFRDDLWGKIQPSPDGAVSSEFLDQLMPLIAVTSPLNLENRDLISKIAHLAQSNEEIVLTGIQVLITAGVLLRGGRWVRIVPDVLADFILEEKCIQAGCSTGWADRVFNELRDVALEPVLRSLSELEWRAKVGSESPVSILGQVWKTIEDDFRAADIKERALWLGRLERLSFLHPAQVWNIVQIARDASSVPVLVGQGEDEEALESFWGIKIPRRTDLNDCLIPILRGIAYDYKYTQRCANWLWEMSVEGVTEAFQALEK